MELNPTLLRKRQRLLTIHEKMRGFLRAHNVPTRPTDIQAVARAVHVTIVRTQTPPGSRAWTMGIADKPDRVVFLNPDLPSEKARFAASHELAHQILNHREYEVGRLWDPASQKSLMRTLATEDREANVAASYLLMPPGEFEEDLLETRFNLPELVRIYSTTVEQTVRRVGQVLCLQGIGQVAWHVFSSERWRIRSGMGVALDGLVVPERLDPAESSAASKAILQQRRRTRLTDMSTFQHWKVLPGTDRAFVCDAYPVHRKRKRVVTIGTPISIWHRLRKSGVLSPRALLFL